MVPGVAALALGFALTGCGAGNEGGSSSSSDSSLSGTLSGSGSSAQQTAMQSWRSAFQTKNSKVTVNYDPAGSGAGVEKFNGGGVDFAASDSPLNADAGEIDAAKKRCGGDAIEVPDYISPIAVIYNLKGVDKLQLDPKTVAGIFEGKITTWDDAAIKADNPGVSLPSTKITPVHRSDDSGTTDNFTDYLSQAGGGAWTSPHSKTWPLKSGEAGAQSSGMVAAVTNAEGSIGYVDDSAAGSLSKASIKVGDAYVAPSADAAGKALAASPLDDSRPENDIAVKVDRTTTESGAYPLILASYLIACPTYKDSGKADAVKAFMAYIVSDDGQQAAAKAAGSAPLPSELAKKAQDAVDTIKAG
ncbi:phosphate ABC transporter substrate-binding protein PstS [Nocardioides mangrovicus]|uniref:Phosphate-binding protein n=2 Tax=Nocardioides mangrovicus TaxID=2478913 RepID=A0A3L8P0N9_9ACTN|nr:phosphate ABC transporter substrate-binding protein PstS [Nocardioides mangrovicus]